MENLDSPLSSVEFGAQLEKDVSLGSGITGRSGARWALSSHMHRYHDGILAEWLEWITPLHALWNEGLGYRFPDEWVEASRECHERVFEEILGQAYDARRYGHVDVYNATDYLFQTLLGGAGTVLDFGAGYGRQAFLWTTQNESVTLVTVDGIEGPYLLQNRVLRSLSGVQFEEYMLRPDDFDVIKAEPATRKVIHLPTWRLDLLPDRFFDLIICVQVLQELPGELVPLLLDEFRRVITPGGMLYIRDYERWRPSHRMRIGECLLREGWRLAFRHPGVHDRDIHGIPRLWTYTGEDTTDITSGRSLIKKLRFYMRHGKPGPADWRDTFLPV